MTRRTPAETSGPLSLAPISIEVGGENSAPFKSIRDLVWESIPPLAVLTGVNGSGKTQLLELLAYKLTRTNHPELGSLESVQVILTGDAFGPESVAYLPNRWDIGSAPVLGIAQMRDIKRQLFQEMLDHHVVTDLVKRARRAQIEKFFGVSHIGHVPIDEFMERLPDDFAFMLHESDVTSGLSHVFMGYRLRAAEMLERGVAPDEVRRELGPPPWDVLNETLQAAEFPYRVTSPMIGGLLDPYDLKLEDPDTGLTLRPASLSSGEKILLELVLWLYNSQEHGRFPRLLLLDEPDAHLHPSMTQHFLNVVKEVLVDRYGVRTILTTHSPSTVALAPEGSIFEMFRTTPRIRASKSKASTIGLLTAGLVTVAPGTRYVLVEDVDDVEFYDAVREILTDYGPSRDARALEPSPTIAFMPASTGTGRNKVGGGSSVVSHWVAKFDEAPLDEIFRGVIDRDAGNMATPRVHVIGRHSIENYLLDPFVVYGVLLDQGTPLSVPNVAISQGDEHRLRGLSEPQLQGIVDAIQAVVEVSLPALTEPEKQFHRVSFTNGKSVDYPTWMIDRRGHDLLPIYQAALGGSRVISHARLYRSFRRVRLLPVELADIMHQLQA